MFLNFQQSTNVQSLSMKRWDLKYAFDERRQHFSSILYQGRQFTFFVITRARACRNFQPNT